MNEISFAQVLCVKMLFSQKLRNIWHIINICVLAPSIAFDYRRLSQVVVSAMLVGMFAVNTAIASEKFDVKQGVYQITLKHHVFTPNVITVPAGKKIKLIITNQDAQPEEFDSFDLNREKVIFPHSNATLYIGPLKAGEYRFFGEFHANSAQGKVIAKETDNAD